MSTSDPHRRFVGSAVIASSLWLALGFAVLALRGVDPRTLAAGAPWAFGLAIGATVGLALAGAQFALLRAWPRWRRDTHAAVRGLRLTPGGIVALSLYVAFAEELFFRAAMQPLLGLPLTAALFALVHVRLDAETFRGEQRVFAMTALALLVAVALVVGAVFAQWGFVAAVALHFVYDVAVLLAYRRLVETSVA